MDPLGTPIPPLPPHLMGVIAPQAVAPAVPSCATNPGLGPQIAPGLPGGHLCLAPMLEQGEDAGGSRCTSAKVGGDIQTGCFLPHKLWALVNSLGEREIS